jgi:LmbE family N-acetylglucosaminyl deacetylase
MKKRQILVLAPHVDDELNCGGLLAKATSQGASAFVFACCSAEEAVPEELDSSWIRGEFARSCGMLRAEGEIGAWPVRRLHEHRQDVLDHFIALRSTLDPDLVVCPSSTDVHQDHHVVYREAMRAFRNAPVILGWESPNNQKDARITTHVTLTAGDLAEKIAAFTCYETQHHRTWFDREMIRSMATVRGRQCRCESGLAEGYELLGMVL